MADRPTGPVKPPVIDLTARAGSSRPETAASSAERVSPSASTAERAPRRQFDITAVLGRYWAPITVVLGVIVAALLAYVISSANRTAPATDLTPQLTAQAERIDALQTELGALKASAADTQAALDAANSRLDTSLSDLGQQVADVKAAIPPAQEPVDLTPLQTELRTLKAQVDAIAAGASGADAGAIAQSLANLETSLTSLSTRLNGVDQTVAALRSDVDAARKTLADHINAALPNEVGPALKLPLILSGLEGAFATGRPFQTELEGLASVLPDFAIPGTLQNAAATGISRPDVLMQRFEAAVPDILAARGEGGGDWVQNATDWLKSLLALRPAGEIEGDSPEAVVSRLEGAMGRRDYTSAVALLQQLPPTMQAEAATVAADIAVHADADALIADLRAKALATAETPQ